VLKTPQNEITSRLGAAELLQPSMGHRTLSRRRQSAKKVFSLLLALSGGVVLLGAKEEIAQPIIWWTALPLTKVRPLDPAPSTPAKSTRLFAARNEFESFQIVVRADGKDLQDVDIDISNLRTKDSAEIAQENICIYLERYLNLNPPSSSGGGGLWPDPLIPRVDRYVHERRNAFPFAVSRGHNQAVWVEVFVPGTARPGTYEGSARVSIAGTVQFSVPINLTVWGFTLPPTSTLKSSFGLSGVAALKQHRGRYTDDEDLYAIARMYAKAALLHRITIHGGSMVPPKYSRDTGGLRLDWRVYDAEVGPFLDGTALSPGEPLYGARSTSAELRTPASLASDDERRLYWNEWTRHFQQKGWLDRLFLYLWDEPAKEDFAALVERGRIALGVSPPVRSLVTMPFTPALASVVQIWVPLVNCLEVKPGFDDYCSQTPPLEIYTNEIQRGKSLWFYQSCASHGCNIAGGPYFAGWPSYMVDVSGVSNRVMQWVAWKYRIEGELYFSMNEAYGHENNPWDSVFQFGGNGDGTLFYPGRPDRIGGRTDIPIESIRLKLIREGMEDYEYLSLLAKLDGRRFADEYADRIVKKPYLWESRPETFLKVRQELGEEVDKLAKSGKTE